MDLSLVICTYNRTPALLACLDSVAAALAHAGAVEAEVVVVDNACDAGTAAAVARWAGENPVSVNLVWEPRRGLSHALNRGLAVARGELLAFTDDDCRLDPEYVEDLLGYDAADLDPVLRGGSVYLGDPADLPLTVKTAPDVVRWSRSLGSARRTNLGDAVLGCNMVMRRAVADKVGPFDVRLGAGSSIPGGEDTDYVIRAYLAGVEIEYVPDMRVYHHHGRRTLAEGRKLLESYSVGGGALYAKYALRSPVLCLPLYWDLKNWRRERRAGRPTFAPEAGFSYADKFRCHLVGAARFLLAPRGVGRRD